MAVAGAVGSRDLRTLGRMTEPCTGSATIVIHRSPQEVWSAIADVTRMGEWSPETNAARWAEGGSAPAVGAKFLGDNAVKVGGRTIKAWTTTSEVTACEPGVVFEFVAEGYTTWRYDFAAEGAGTTVTESFSYVPKGLQGFIYGTVLRRRSAMTKGMRSTLARVKSTLESA